MKLEIITIEHLDLNCLRNQATEYQEKGCKLLKNAYIKEVVVHGNSDFRRSQIIEVPAKDIIAEIPATPAKEPFKKGWSEHEARYHLRRIVDSCFGWFSAYKMAHVLADASGWDASYDLRRFVGYTLLNRANRGELLKENRRSVNYYRRKIA